MRNRPQKQIFAGASAGFKIFTAYIYNKDRLRIQIKTFSAIYIISARKNTDRNGAFFLMTL